LPSEVLAGRRHIHPRMTEIVDDSHGVSHLPLKSSNVHSTPLP
jgi:hypothetical protein